MTVLSRKGSSHQPKLEPRDASSLCGSSAGPAAKPALPPTARVPQPEKGNMHLFPFHQMRGHKIPSTRHPLLGVTYAHRHHSTHPPEHPVQKAQEMQMN